jgi:hypothetical protein
MLLRWITAILLTMGIAFGQGGTGSITGSVTDSSGAVVPGAVVTATNQGTGFKREVTVSSAGEYSLAGLQPGVYSLTATSPQFKTFSVKDLRLEVDQVARVEARLEVGAVTEIVEVTGQSALLQTEQSSVGAVVDQQKIVNFPLNGRNFVQLGLLLPGVNEADGGKATGSNNLPGGGISISGLRPEQNSFLLDGTINTDQYQNILVVRPSVDAIQEFKIQTSSYSAEFGKGAGGQINVVTRSGTNQLHGTLFEFNRNNAVQARNLFDRNPAFKTSDGRFKAPPFNQNQFGLTLGGPVIIPKTYNGKDKTFFFVNYEGFRLRRGNTTLTQVPTPAMKNGDFSSFLGAGIGTDANGQPVRRNTIYDPFSSTLVGSTYVRVPFPNNIIPGNRMDPASRRAVAFPGLFPDPNIAGTRATNGNPVQNYFDGRTVRNDYDLFSVRADHQFSAKDTIMARYSLTDGNGFDPRTFPGYGALDNQRTMAGTFAYTRILGPTALNELRFGYLRYAEYQASENTSSGTDIVKQLGITGLTFASTPGLVGAPLITIGGFADIGDGDGPFRPRNNTFQLMDQFSFHRGRHSIKFGGEIRRSRMAITRANTLRGSFDFGNPNWTGLQGFSNTGNTFASFLLGLERQKGRRVSGFFQDLRSTEYAGFVQDDWKVNSKLTFNIGLRYMFYGPPTETADRISTTTFPLGRPTNYKEGALFYLVPGNQKYAPNWGRAGIELPRSLYPADKKNWGPRFGFAYSPVNKTVVRGGYGIFYDTVPGYITQDTLENLPNLKEDQQSLSLYQDGPPPSEGFLGFLIANPGPGQFNPGPNDVSTNFKNAYVQHWNFGIQRELPGNILLEVSYVGNKGTRLNRRENSNSAEPNGPFATVQLKDIPAQPINPVTGKPFLSDPLANADLRPRFRRLVPYAINIWENNALYLVDNIFQTTSSAFSNYNAAQLRLEKRSSKGLSWITSYTFSKAMSDATAFTGGGDFDTGNRIQNTFDKKADKGLASLDHRQRLSIASIYELPFGPGKPFLSGGPKVLGKVVGGWVLNGIYTYQTGLPITVKFNGDPFGSGTNNARPDAVCNPNLDGGSRTVDRFFATSCFKIQSPIRYGNAGRSLVTGPLVNNFDVGILKDTSITERIKTQLRVEFFNFLNHPQWLPPNRNVDQAAFGVISSARDPRIIQFGLKVMF